MAPPTGRFEIAFTDDTLEPAPTWTQLDQDYPNLVAEYTIDRGRSFELDRVDTGRAVVTINDVDGILDPTNATSPFDGDIEPLKQARLAVWDPVREDWFTRFRGFVESFEYVVHPSQLVNQVTINLVDIFEIIQAVQMFPGFFGDPIPSENLDTLGGNVFFEDTTDGDVHGMQRRVTDILNGSVPPMLGTCGIPSEFYEVFSGNVALHESTYSAGESAMTAIQEAVDAEFPGVGNVYANRLGILAVHGRYARFDPVGTSAATGWDFHDWAAGDGTEVAIHPSDTAHIRSFSFSRDLAKIINLALASPVTKLSEANYDTKIAANTVESPDGGTSKGLYGIRPWSAQNLITKEGVTDEIVFGGTFDDWRETKKFATYYATNYAAPQDRITQIGFRSMDVDATGAAANWALLAECDINDRVSVTLGNPGGGGFDGTDPSGKFFIEGIHEEHRPLQGDAMDDITVTLDLSPASYFSDNPFST